MTLANPPSNEVTEPEQDIFWNKARLPLEGLGHQSYHKTIDQQFVLTTRCAGENELEEITNNDWSNFWPMSERKPMINTASRTRNQSWIAQRLDPNTTGPKFKEMIPNDILLNSQTGT